MGGSMTGVSPDDDVMENPFGDTSEGVVATICTTRGHGRGGL